MDNPTPGTGTHLDCDSDSQLAQATTRTRPRRVPSYRIADMSSHMESISSSAAGRERRAKYGAGWVLDYAARSSTTGGGR